MNQFQQHVQTAALNDQFRWGDGSLGLYSLSPQVEALPVPQQQALFEAVSTTHHFIEPQAHDFGLVSLDETDFFWEIDYYSQDLKATSPNPADPAATVRVLSILRTDEYDR